MKKVVNLFIALLITYLINGCVSMPTFDNPVDPKNFVPTSPTVTTTSVTNVTTNSASSGGNVTSQGSSAVTARGVCWSTSQNPTIANSKTTDGTGTGSFTSSISGLSPSTTYYVRAYATNSSGTNYGDQLSFTTNSLNAPTVTTASITNVSTNSANSGGNVTSQGSTAVTARGVCWSASQNPTIADNKTTDGTGTGSFTSSVTGLSPSTTYYVRAYATNSSGTNYGDQLSFTTNSLNAPTVTTSSITSITENSASSGGNVTSQGSTSVTARGVCWSTSQNPTIADNKTSDGTGTGSFTSSISGLSPGTTYYVRAYGTNSAGTSYGNQVSFTTTSSTFVCGTSTVTYSGKTYNTVLIGSQCWLKENLNVGTRINGSNNQTNNSTIEKYCYNDQESNCNTYGGLYQWDEAMKYVTTPGTQGICPTGWHIPTLAEFETLKAAVNNDGNALKAIGQGTGSGAGTNTSGFSALLAGYRNSSGGFYNLGFGASFCGSTEGIAANADGLNLYSSDSFITFGIGSKYGGFSVRCVQD